MGTNIAHIVPAATATELHKCCACDETRSGSWLAMASVDTHLYRQRISSSNTYYQLLAIYLHFVLLFFTPKIKHNLSFLVLMLLLRLPSLLPMLAHRTIVVDEKKNNKNNKNNNANINNTRSSFRVRLRTIPISSTFFCYRTTSRVYLCVLAFLLPLLLYF